MNKPRFVMVLAVSLTLLAAQRQPPDDLARRLEKAHVEGTLVSWCQGQFEAGRQRSYAAALKGPGGGGRYVVVDNAAMVVELARFKGEPDLACRQMADIGRYAS